jgi:hypothetical protein
MIALLSHLLLIRAQKMAIKSTVFRSFISCLLFVFTTQLHAGMNMSVPEQKAKIIVHLIKTVGWPNGSVTDNQFNVCLLSIDENTFIDNINKAKVKDYTVNVRKLAKVSEAIPCQIVYIGKQDAKNVDAIKKVYKGKPVLLLGDIDQFALDGGSMNFVLVGQQVAITVNLESLKNSKLEFDLKEYNRFTVIPTKDDLK